MTNDEIRDALVILKQRALNVAPLSMSADRHVNLIELIVDGEALLRGFPPLSMRPRKDIEADIESTLNDRR